MNPSAEVFIPRDGPVLNPKAIIFGPSQRQVPVGYEHGEGFIQGQDEFGGAGYVSAYANGLADQFYDAVWPVQLQNNEDQYIQYQQYPQAPSQHLYVYGDQQAVNDAYYNDYRQLTPRPYQETFEHPLGRLQREKSQQEQAQSWNKSYGRENDQENMIGRPQYFVAAAYPPGFVNYGMDQHGRTLDAYGNYNITPMASSPDQSYYGDFGHNKNYNHQAFPKSKRWGKNKSGRKAKSKQNKNYKKGQLRLPLELEEQNNTAQNNMLSLGGEPGSSKQQDSKDETARDATVRNVILGGASGLAENNDSKQGGASGAVPQDAILSNDGGPGSSNQDVVKQDFARKAAPEEVISWKKAGSKKQKKNREASARKAALQAAISLNGEELKALKETAKQLGEITNTGGEQMKNAAQKMHAGGDENGKTPLDGQIHTGWTEEMEGMFGQDESGDATLKW